MQTGVLIAKEIKTAPFRGIFGSVMTNAISREISKVDRRAFTTTAPS